MGKTLQQQHQVDLAREVEEGGRLVEQNHRRLLRERLRYHHLLHLAVAEAAHAALSHRRNADALYRLAHDEAVVAGEAPPEAGVGRTSERNKFLDSHVASVGARGEHNRNNA